MARKPVLISYPCGNMVHADFAMSLSYLLMQAMFSGIEIGISQTRGSIICASRNLMVHQALNSGLDFGHILFLDSDMTFPRTCLERLLSHKVPIIGASYCMRMAPRAMTHRDLEGSSRLPLLGDFENNIFEVASLGMGCVLIETEVFRLVQNMFKDEPLFHVEYRSPILHTSEDISFFRKCKHFGLAVMCDVELSYHMGHVGDYRYTTYDVQRMVGSTIEPDDSVIVGSGDFSDTEIKVTSNAP